MSIAGRAACPVPPARLILVRMVAGPIHEHRPDKASFVDVARQRAAPERFIVSLARRAKSPFPMSFDGLYALVRNALAQDRLSGALFVVDPSAFGARRAVPG